MDRFFFIMSVKVIISFASIIFFFFVLLYSVGVHYDSSFAHKKGE